MDNTAEYFLSAWLIIGLLLFTGTAFYQGFKYKDESSSKQHNDNLESLVILVIGWPLFLVAAIIVASFFIIKLPIIGLRKLGQLTSNLIKDKE